MCPHMKNPKTWPTWPTFFKDSNKGRHLKVPLHPTLPPLSQHLNHTSISIPNPDSTTCYALYPQPQLPVCPPGTQPGSGSATQPEGQGPLRVMQPSCSRRQGLSDSREHLQLDHSFFSFKYIPSFKYISNIILQPGSVTDLEIYQIIEYSNHSSRPVTQVALAVLAMVVSLVINISQISTLYPLLAMVVVHMKSSHISISNSKSP